MTMTMMAATSTTTRLNSRRNYSCCLLSLSMLLLSFHNGLSFITTTPPSLSRRTTSAFQVLLKSASIDTATNTAGGGGVTALSVEEQEGIWNRAKDFALEEIPKDYHKEYFCLESHLKEGRELLKQSIHLQSGCIEGTINSNIICGEATTEEETSTSSATTMVISQLRFKIQRLEALEERAKHPQSSPPSESVVPLVATELALGAMVVVVAIFWTTLEISDLSQAAGEGGDAVSEYIPPQHIHDWWSSFVHHFL